MSKRDHYQTRIVGAVEATYDVLGWTKHSNFREVLFVNTNLRGQDTNKLRTDIDDLNEDSEDIYTKTHAGKSMF